MNIILFIKGSVGLFTYKTLLEHSDFSILPIVHRKNIEALSFLPPECISFSDESDLISIIQEYSPLWLVNAWSDFIFTPEVLGSVKHNVNIHPSYLPWGRGSDCTSHCLEYNYPIGFTFHSMTSSLDDGEIYFQKQIYPPQFSTGDIVQSLLIEEIMVHLKEYLPLILRFELSPRAAPVYDHTDKCYAINTRKMTEAARVRSHDTFDTVDELINWILAHHFSPNSFPQLLTRYQKFSIQRLHD